MSASLVGSEMCIRDRVPSPALSSRSVSRGDFPSCPDVARQRAHFARRAGLSSSARGALLAKVAARRRWR
eukprot:3471747-Alexandrium_andersonii.AAC.1